MATRPVYLVAILTCVAGVGLSAVAAAQAGADPAAGAIGGLAIYGPLGMFCLWLMWRDRTREAEHRAEREAAWKGLAALSEKLGAKMDAQNESLMRIETTLRERGGGGPHG